MDDASSRLVLVGQQSDGFVTHSFEGPSHAAYLALPWIYFDYRADLQADKPAFDERS